MCEVSGADEVEAFDVCEAGDFAYDHLFACGAAVFAVDVEVSDNSHVFSPTLKFFGLLLSLSEEQQTIFLAHMFEANFEQTLYLF